ncbi:hypothetical protein [Elizabethkingia sp. JS20170427COW]|uniref:hypothetical protein n=1 Tax=Elizabethkingia sp. JS20170427COW TaxID=2583851 RepID=UPI0011103CF1|nr:hypothetical protein [Elizabethkingia sp. JS20170427COW]QCX53455.1 hypothetical protein FGE20_06750 [Elizabethkingia sp. JS20170427COW]
MKTSHPNIRVATSTSKLIGNPKAHRDHNKIIQKRPLKKRPEKRLLIAENRNSLPIPAIQGRIIKVLNNTYNIGYEESLNILAKGNKKVLPEGRTLDL